MGYLHGEEHWVDHTHTISPVGAATDPPFVLGPPSSPTLSKKSHIRLVLLTSILTRSLASLRRSWPPLRAYSDTRVSLMTRKGLGRMRSWEHNVCSAGVKRWREAALARFRGAAKRFSEYQHRNEQSSGNAEIRTCSSSSRFGRQGHIITGETINRHSRRIIETVR